MDCIKKIQSNNLALSGSSHELSSHLDTENHKKALAFGRFTSVCKCFSTIPRCRSPPPFFRFQQNPKIERMVKFENYTKAEETYERTKRRYKAAYSLEQDDGIERDIVFLSLSPHEIYERRLTHEQLYDAIAALPEKQAKRVYAHFFLGMNKAVIARSEGVSKKAIRIAIERGLKSIEKH